MAAAWDTVQIQKRIQRLFGRGFPPVVGNTVAEQRLFITLLLANGPPLLNAYKHEERWWKADRRVK